MTIELPEACDVAIVGGGPAGLAAATELRASGVRNVVVLEREPEAGGIPRHCGHYPFGMRELHRVLRGPDYAARLVARARLAGVEIHTGITVTALRPSGTLELSTPQGLRQLSAQRVLLCTGVREKSRTARLIGGTRPGGVLSTGALQGMVYLKGIAPFRRPVILGTELVSFSALMTCRHAGIRPVAMIEAGSRTTARWPSQALPRVMGVQLMLNTELCAIHGDSRVEEVVIREADGTTRRIATDGVIVSGRFLPEASLLQASHLAVDRRSGGPRIDQFGRCSDPAFFAAGNLLRPVETAGWSWAEGRKAGRAIAASLAGRLPAPQGGLSLNVKGDALKYVLPHRLVPGGAPETAVTRIQMRVTRAARGRLRLLVDGAEVWSRRFASLPERRIDLPLSLLPAGAEGTAEFILEEADE
jgi:NADPH-dependent 2,4-dienoyl-CoA reductase/sulfur reductase-like enzyme